MLDMLRGLWEQMVPWLPRMATAVGIAVAALLVARWLRRLAEGIAKRGGGPGNLGQVLGRTIYLITLGLGAAAVLTTLNLGPAVYSFIAGLGIVGLILGFALQDIARQFASGVLLLTLRPFELGDIIQVREYRGNVISVTLLTTILRSADGHEIRIPNADVYTSPIMNFSRYGQQRYMIVVALPVGSDLEAAATTLLARLEDVPGVSKTPPPEVVWGEIVWASETVQGEARFWVNLRDHTGEHVRSAAVVAVRRAIAQH